MMVPCDKHSWVNRGAATVCEMCGVHRKGGAHSKDSKRNSPLICDAPPWPNKPKGTSSNINPSKIEITQISNTNDTKERERFKKSDLYDLSTAAIKAVLETKYSSEDIEVIIQGMLYVMSEVFVAAKREAEEDLQQAKSKTRTYKKIVTGLERNIAGYSRAYLERVDFWQNERKELNALLTEADGLLERVSGIIGVETWDAWAIDYQAYLKKRKDTL